jgi:TPP-dependent pyruvate/acetoin dehydrogenase alpha subunit
MMAELFGRATGICKDKGKGKGGSMHIAHVDNGMLGANGIVGGDIALATGAELTAQVKKSCGVAVGDGASNPGSFHESLNRAATWKLPAIYVVGDNGSGAFTPVKFVIPVENIVARAASYAINALVADGNDFFDVFEKATEALAAGSTPDLAAEIRARLEPYCAGRPAIPGAR